MIKPYLAVAQRSDWGATTSPDLTAGLVEYLQKNNFYNIAIAESSWAGDDTKKAFTICGYEDIKKIMVLS